MINIKIPLTALADNEHTLTARTTQHNLELQTGSSGNEQQKLSFKKINIFESGAFNNEAVEGVPDIR